MVAPASSAASAPTLAPHQVVLDGTGCFTVELSRQLDKRDGNMAELPYGFEFSCRKASLLGRGTIVTVTEVLQGSAAWLAGVQLADLIVEIRYSTGVLLEVCRQEVRPVRCAPSPARRV